MPLYDQNNDRQYDTLRLPEKGVICLVNQHEIRPDISDCDYHIISYISSNEECVACNLKFSVWTSLLERFNTLSESKVSFIFVINTSDINHIKSLSKQFEFKYPIIIDSTQTFAIENKLPLDTSKTFLLDSNLKVIGEGNPTRSKDVAEKFMNLILGDNVNSEDTSDFISLEPSYIMVGSISQNQEFYYSSIIRNESDSTYYIKQIYTSCDCLTVSATDSILRPHNFIVLKSYLDTHKIPIGKFTREASIVLSDSTHQLLSVIEGYIYHQTM